MLALCYTQPVPAMLTKSHNQAKSGTAPCENCKLKPKFLRRPPQTRCARPSTGRLQSSQSRHLRISGRAGRWPTVLPPLPPARSPPGVGHRRRPCAQRGSLTTSRALHVGRGSGRLERGESRPTARRRALTQLRANRSCVRVVINIENSLPWC